MKLKVTKKEIKEHFTNIITIGNCNGEDILQYKNADYYSTRSEGWACDYYIINSNTIICTGYAPIDSKYRDYELTKKYNDKARKIIYNRDIDYKTKEKKVNKLLEKYVNEILKIKD